MSNTKTANFFDRGALKSKPLPKAKFKGKSKFKSEFMAEMGRMARAGMMRK